MRKYPLVTIGIINYNCIRFLETCVASYLNQTYPNLEILLVDDCSTDGSVKRLKELEQSHNNIRCIYYDENSGGPSRGIQRIIKEAKGKYFQWLSSDDFVEADAVEKFVDFLEKTNNDYVYCNLNVVNQNNLVYDHWNYTVPELKEMVLHIFSFCSGIIPMNGLYRTDFFRKSGITWKVYKGNDYSSDTINSLYFVKNEMRYSMLQDNLINYRIHDENYSHNIEKRIKTSLSVYDYIIQNFSEELYFPQIEWNKFKNREQIKNYAVAWFYYNRIISYMHRGSIPKYLNYTITDCKMKECLKDYRKEGLKYIRKGLTQGETSKNELLELKKKYNGL